MAGKRSEKWSDERLAQVKELMLEGWSMSKIGEKLVPKETRNSVIGIITRNPDYFKGVPRLPPFKPQAAIDFARGKPRGTKMSAERGPVNPKHLVMEGPEALKDMTAITGQAEELGSKWRQYSKGEKIFIYLGMALEPTYRFTRPYPGAAWRGHGVYALTKGLIFYWVNRQGVPR